MTFSIKNTGALFTIPNLGSMISGLAIQILLATAAVAAPSINVTPHERTILDDFTIQITGAAPNGKVVVEASLTDARKRIWTSRGVYTADFNGAVNPATSASLEGTYTGVNRHGLIWSMLPLTAKELTSHMNDDPVEAGWPMAPALGLNNPTTITFRTLLETSGPVSSSQTQELKTTHLVHGVAEGLRRREINEWGIRGILYTPLEPGEYPPVLIVTGSEGGASERNAALLASQGFSALALAHFSYPGRPEQLLNIPLEYFRSAIEWLAAETGQKRVALSGGSRGGEAVLLIASTYPELVSAVVAGVPSNVALGACCSPATAGQAAWTLAEKPIPTWGVKPWGLAQDEKNREVSLSQDYSVVWRLMLQGMLAAEQSSPFAIPVENIRAPILLISGDADAVWASKLASDKVIQRLQQNGFAFPAEHLSITGAGHSVSIPLLVTSLIGTKIRHPVNTAIELSLGGLPSATYYGGLQAQRRRIEFLRGSPTALSKELVAPNF